MKSAVKITRHVVTADDARARVREFEAAHPGMTRHNCIDMYCDERGVLHETDDFFAALEVCQALEYVERADAVKQAG